MLVSLVFIWLVAGPPREAPAGDLWDLHFRAGDDVNSARHQLRSLEEERYPLFPGISTADSRAVAEELTLRMLRRRTFSVGCFDLAAAALRRFLEREHSPLVAALARVHLGTYLWKQGKFGDAWQAWATLGFIVDWWILGPFDNERGRGFEVATLPEGAWSGSAEGGPDDERSYPGKRGPVTWRQWSEPGRAGRVELSELLRPSEEALAFLLTHIHAPRPQPVTFRVAGSGAYALWLNDEEIARYDVERRAGYDQDTISAHLAPGWNRLRVTSGHTKGRWSFALRITAPDGALLPALRVRADLPAGEKPVERKRMDRNPVASEGALTLLHRAAPTAEVLRARGWLLSDRHAHDLHTHPDRDVLRAAADAAPADAVSRYLLARTYVRTVAHAAEREENAWRLELEAALRVDANFHRARLDLARYYLNRFGNLTRAQELLKPILDLPRPPSSALQLAAVIRKERYGAPSARKWDERREARLGEENLLSLRSSLAAKHWRAGRVEDAEEILLGAVARDATARKPRHELAQLLLQLGRTSEARAQYERLVDAFPQRGRIARDLAEFEFSQENWGRALEAIDRALIIAPGEETYHRRRGELLELLERPEAARDAFETALRIEPNQPRLREYMEFRLKKPRRTLADAGRIPSAELVDAALDTPETANHPVRILLDNQVVDIETDGTTHRYRQFIAKILNDRGIRLYDRYSIPYAYGEQWVQVLRARVHHGDGSREEAAIRNREPRVRRGEYPLWSRAGVDLPPLQIGDVLEIEYRLEDLRQSFFGDYFGDRVEFADATHGSDHIMYTIRAPRDKQLYLHQPRLTVEPSVTVEGDRRVWRWDVRGMDKIDAEPGMPPLAEVVPAVEVSSFGDWNEFTRWYYHLIRKQFEPSAAIRRKVNELTGGARSAREKIRALYNFVVSDVRYIAWEFGIHGFKPYSAATIFERRFGDCKDKATLLCTMLAQIDIKAHPVLIYATRGRGAEDLALPLMRHFNHCIVYVPDDGNGREMFLDGTAEHHSIDELPMGDRGAVVLVVRPDGGEIRTLPWNLPQEQAIHEKARIVIDGEGGARIRQENHFRGDFAVNARSRFEIEGQRKTQLERLWGRRFPGTQVESVATSLLRDLDQPVWLRLDLDVPDYWRDTEGEATLPPVIDLLDTTGTLRQTASRPRRHFDLLIGNPSLSELEWEIELPPGYQVADLPPPVDLETPFARFRWHASAALNTVSVKRTLEILTPRVRVADYSLFRSFVDAVERARDGRLRIERIRSAP